MLIYIIAALERGFSSVKARRIMLLLSLSGAALLGLLLLLWFLLPQLRG